MTRQELRKRIENYPPFNEQEERDKTLILDWIQKNENAFLRENEVAHITASAWVVNKDRSKVLMVLDYSVQNSYTWVLTTCQLKTNNLKPTRRLSLV